MRVNTERLRKWPWGGGGDLLANISYIYNKYLLSTVVYSSSPFLEDTLRLFSFSLFGLAFTREAATSWAVLAAMSCDATTSSSNFPVP